MEDLKKKFCSEKMMIIALNTLDQPPKESKFRTLNYYNNILESDKIYKPTQVAYYLHELKFHIYDTKANCYEVDKMYFFKFVEIFVDLYMYVFKTSSLEETITKVMVNLSTDINNEKTKKNRVHLTKILKEYVNKNRKK